MPILTIITTLPAVGTHHSQLLCLSPSSRTSYRRTHSKRCCWGISGGIVMGYFTFAYAGMIPHVALLTYNTFDLNTLLWPVAGRGTRGAPNQ